MDTTGTVDYSTFGDTLLIGTLEGLTQRMAELATAGDLARSWDHRQERTRVERELLRRMAQGC